MKPKRLFLLVIALAGFMATPNGPARWWYSIPERVCDVFHSDEDQWLCDEPALWPQG